VTFLLQILMIIPAQTDRLTNANDYIYEIVNGLAGRSLILDNLIGLPLESNLVKAALLGACFVLCWIGGADEAETARRRKILLITLISSVFVIAITKTLSKTVFLPRPFILSQKTFHLKDDQLVESPRLEYRIPLDKESQKGFNAMKRGEIIQNDLGSFPSDHAGFYMTLAAGIFLACRSLGLIAIFWTLFVTLGSRVVTGQHSPLDIAVGSGIGVGVLLVSQFIIGNWGKKLLDPVINWTFKNSAIALAIIFVFIFEATNTLENVRHVARTFVEIAKHLIRG
jgi:membrane-associated phospholipid phosphatase